MFASVASFHFSCNRVSKRKQEQVRKSKERVSDLEFEFAVARQVHLIQDVWNPAESFL